MKKRAGLLFVVVWAIACICGCGGKEGSQAGGNVKIYLSLSSADTFRTVLVNSAKETAEKNGATLDVYEADESIELQAEQMMERGDESTEDSETIKMGYDQTENNLVKQAQELMIQYWSQYYSLDSLRQRKIQAERSYQSEQNRLSAGMSTQAKVLSAKEAVSSAEASILSGESNLEKTKESLCLMLGWSYGADVEIGELPEPDLEQIGTIDVESDIQVALEKNYSLRLTERRLSNARTDKVRDTLEQTRKNQREAVSVNVKDSYTGLLLARSNYEQACQAFEMERISMDSAKRKLAAGTITANAYYGQEDAYLTAEVGVKTKKLELLNAFVDYEWAVNGLAAAS